MVYTEYVQAQAYPHSNQLCKLFFFLFSISSCVIFSLLEPSQPFATPHIEPDFTDFIKGLKGPVSGEDVQKKKLLKESFKAKGIGLFC